MNTFCLHENTELLQAWGPGEESFLQMLGTLFCEELRPLPHRFMELEHRSRVLQTTTLVNEVYLRLTDPREQHGRST
ncbi:MAG TPA: ECF-type sigma factor [Terriglobia bacterium]|nr:ECF-type sigma factor [Terriglobia bacterium]